MPNPGTKRLQSLGATESFFVTAKNARQVTIPFAVGDGLSGKFSRGKDQASLFTPALSWSGGDPTTGKVNVVITAAMLAGAGVVPGTYHLEVFATPVSDGQPRGIYDADYEIKPSAGTAPAPSVYAGPDDLTTYAPEIRVLMASDVTETNFADQRHRARTRFERVRLDMYRPMPGRSRRLVNGCYEFGPAPDGSAPPTQATVQGWFDAGKLVVTQDILQANACYAAALVYLGGLGRNNEAELGKQLMIRAEMGMREVVVDFDPTNSGAGTVRIDRDVTYLT